MRQMLEEKCSIEKTERQQFDLHAALWKITVLDEQLQALDGAKTSLLEIERKLVNMIDQEIEGRAEKREMLEGEVTELKQRCDKLLFFVNTFRQEQP
jgi:hypothetical protein